MEVSLVGLAILPATPFVICAAQPRNGYECSEVGCAHRWPVSIGFRAYCLAGSYNIHHGMPWHAMISDFSRSPSSPCWPALHMS
eukprot:914683-Amphidinium_carterae.3